jgi:hypothetical protein
MKASVSSGRGKVLTPTAFPWHLATYHARLQLFRTKRLRTGRSKRTLSTFDATRSADAAIIERTDARSQGSRFARGPFLARQSRTRAVTITPPVVYDQKRVHHFRRSLDSKQITNSTSTHLRPAPPAPERLLPSLAHSARASQKRLWLLVCRNDAKRRESVER